MTCRIYEFCCPDGHVFDRYIDEDVSQIDCKHCNLVAKKIISVVRLGMSMGVDTDMTTMADKWAKMHKDEAKRQNAKIDPNPSS
jgi:hypothetical protein